MGDYASPRLCLVPHSIVNLRGHTCVVERRLNNEWWLLDVATNEPYHETDEALARLQSRNEFFVVAKPGDRENPVPAPEPLLVGEHAHQDALRRLKFVQECLAHADFKRSKRILKPIIAAIANREGGETPGFSTVLGWIDRFNKFGPTHGAAALAARHDRKGKRGHRMPEYQELAISAGIEVWLQRGTKTAAYASVCNKVYDLEEAGSVDKAALEARYFNADGTLKLPSERQFFRRCDEISPAARDWIRIGERFTKGKYRTFETRKLPDVPYAEVEVDHCTLDLLLIHPNGTLLGRADLVIFRDRATGMVIGYGLGFDQPSYASFVVGLQHAMYPKDLSAFPNVKSGWPAWGRIQNLVTDQGKHFVGGNIDHAAAQLGINLIPLPGRSPWLKGAIERFFRTLNTGLVHSLPGTTLENAVARRDYETLGQATLTVEQFEALLVYWICEVYNKSPSKGLGFIRGYGGESPLDAWNKKANGLVTDILPRDDLFLAMTGDVNYRTIQNNGMSVDSIIYEGPELARILGHPKHSRKSGKPTQYKTVRDPHNLAIARVVNHHTGEVLSVQPCAAHRDYADGLSIVEHDIIRAQARKQFNKKPGFKELMQAKAWLNEYASAITSTKSFKTVQRRLARFLDNDRVRPLRSQITPFSDSGEDYLTQSPTIRPEPATAPGNVGDIPNMRLKAMPAGAKPTEVAQEDDLADLRKLKKWESSYD